MKYRSAFVFVPMAIFAMGAFAQGKPSPSPAAASAQQVAGGPVVLQRTAPLTAGKATHSRPTEIPTPEKYPFGPIMNELQQQEAAQKLKDGSGKRAGIAPDASARLDEENVPSSFVERKDVPLTPTAMDAVALSSQIVNERNTPAPSADGKVVYTFGVGLPTVVCAPLRVCSLELQTGEKIAGEPQIGDTVRWGVTPATSGTGDFATPVLVVKPKISGLDTTMIVTTDRRTYYVRLISKAQEFVARTAFSYPDDEHIQWKQFLAKQQSDKEERLETSRVAPTATDAIDKIFFEYEIKVGHGAGAIRPERVMDDGEKTYVQMPETALHRELPALVIQGPTGNEMVNYRVKGNTYVVDRLFDRAALLMGSGKKQQKVELIRKQALTPEAK